MSHAISPGYRRIERHDQLFQEQIHDPYQTSGKPDEPTVCPQCHAVYGGGRWHWGTVPADAHAAICPACHRIHDHFPAGFVTLEGEFFRTHHDEILHLIRHHEAHERTEHPLQRIMAIEEGADGAMVTTTDIHLARGIGEALHKAYKGALEYHYNPAEALLRVHWTH
jgi:NMD protein affecting ribosome stability and mRNA decay